MMAGVRQQRVRGWLGVLAAFATACGGPSAPAPTAVVVMMPAQPTVAATVCPPEHCGPLAGQMEVVTSVTVRETAGVGGVIRQVTLALRRQSDNANIAGGAEGQGVRFPARGSVTVPLAIHYDQSLGERNMKVVATLEADDDNGHRVTATVEIEVITNAGAEVLRF